MTITGEMNVTLKSTGTTYRVYSVQSFSSEEQYQVGTLAGKVISCSCKSHSKGHRTCKHMAALQDELDNRKRREESSKRQQAQLNGNNREFSLMR